MNQFEVAYHPSTGANMPDKLQLDKKNLSTFIKYNFIPSFSREKRRKRRNNPYTLTSHLLMKIKLQLHPDLERVESSPLYPRTDAPAVKPPTAPLTKSLFIL